MSRAKRLRKARSRRLPRARPLEPSVGELLVESAIAVGLAFVGSLLRAPSAPAPAPAEELELELVDGAYVPRARQA